MNKTTARIKFYKKRQHYLLVVVKKVNNNNKTQREKFEMFFFMRISFASKKICMHVFYYCILNIYISTYFVLCIALCVDSHIFGILEFRPLLYLKV